MTQVSEAANAPASAADAHSDTPFDAQGATEEVLFDVTGGIGLMRMNRPKALNALNLNMIRLMNEKLAQWAADDAVKAVVIAGAGDRAFCAGGDVKTVALDAKAQAEGKSDGALVRDFFREEYTLNQRIHAFKKPYISLVDGIVMGGGKGVSAHGSHRVVTENTLFAMPETNIGFFPDVGGGYFLPRCPGQTGVYLALTSKRIKATDTIYIGFGTQFVPSEKLGALLAALQAVEWDAREKPVDQVTQVIESFSAEPPCESEIAPNRALIDRYFGHDAVEQIIADLQADGGDFANETLTAIYGMSPTSLKVALRQIRQGASLSFESVMTMEYRLSQACARSHDFYEGIRAALIDKDRQPKWDPARVADVDDALIEGYFKPLGENDLAF
ncbi:MAG: enoyl-CoA hydratase/isomerase family protein [Alphaproteobacteria bacterium]|nr:enoyl-CoA hydratase/isomerase family protein [Alphaproteobacteria bacterium]